VYCAQADRVYEVPAFEAACELLYRRRVAGATVLSGVDGTVGGRPLHARFLRHGTGAPLMVAPWAAVSGSECCCPNSAACSAIPS